jgi:hypothetical protein
MQSTHRLDATTDESPDHVRIERTDTGLIALTVDQPKEMALRKRTLIFMRESTLKTIAAASAAFLQNEAAFALPEHLDVEF